MDATLLLVYSATSFIISFLLFPVLIKLLHYLEMFDKPGSHKIHDRHTPSIGGAPIIIAFVFALVFALPFGELSKLKIFFIALTLMFITGLRDDILTLTPRQKLVSQLLPIFILVIFGAVKLESFYGLSSIQFPLWFSITITIFTITILTNAYNLIDGLDGLAGTIAAIVFAFYGFWFFSTSNFTLALIATSFFGGTLAFIAFNWQPAKIFMGDTGALPIGLLLSFLTIQFINLNFQLPSEFTFRFQASIATAVSVLIVPIFDTLRVIIIRLSHLQSPFKADKNHLHHQFIKLGFSHAQSVLFLAGINVLCIMIAIILRNQPDKVILPIIGCLCLAIHVALLVSSKRKYERTNS